MPGALIAKHTGAACSGSGRGSRTRCAAPAADRFTGRTESRTAAAELQRYHLTAAAAARPERAAGKATAAPGRRFSELIGAGADARRTDPDRRQRPSWNPERIRMHSSRSADIYVPSPTYQIFLFGIPVFLSMSKKVPRTTV